MTSRKRLLKVKAETLKKIAELGAMRKGSLTVHYQNQKLKDGSVKKLGPYTIYTFKRDNKTVSRRLSDKKIIETYRRQIENFRRLQDLSARLLDISQQLADLEVSARKEEKKTSRK